MNYQTGWKQQQSRIVYDKMEGNNDMNIATYQTTPEKHGNGTYFFTDCGHNMYSVRDNMAYHGCL